MLFNKIYKFFSNKCYVDVIYNKIILKLFYTISYDYIRFVDRGIIELFGPLGFVRISTHILNFIKFFQIGLIYNYIFVFIIASICVIFSFFVFFEFEF